MKPRHIIKDCKHELQHRLQVRNNQTLWQKKFTNYTFWHWHQKLPMTPHGMCIRGPHNIMCYERESFINCQACESWEVVFLGDNTIHQIARQREVAIKLL